MEKSYEEQRFLLQEKSITLQNLKMQLAESKKNKTKEEQKSIHQEIIRLEKILLKKITAFQAMKNQEGGSYGL